MTGPAKISGVPAITLAAPFGRHLANVSGCILITRRVGLMDGIRMPFKIFYTKA